MRAVDVVRPLSPAAYKSRLQALALASDLDAFTPQMVAGVHATVVQEPGGLSSHQWSALLRETDALHAQAVVNALARLTAAAEHAGGFARLAAAAAANSCSFFAVTKLLPTLLVRSIAQDTAQEEAYVAGVLCACGSLRPQLAATTQRLLPELTGVLAATPLSASAKLVLQLARGLLSLSLSFAFPVHGATLTDLSDGELQARVLPCLALAARLLPNIAATAAAAVADFAAAQRRSSRPAGPPRSARELAELQRDGEAVEEIDALNSLAILLNATARQLVDAVAFRWQGLPECLVQSDDLALLMAVYCALTVAQTRRVLGDAAAGVPAETAALLAALGVPQLAGVDLSSVKVFRKGALDAVVRVLHRAMCAATLRQHLAITGKLPLSLMLSDGQHRLPGGPGSALPLLLTLVEAAQLSQLHDNGRLRLGGDSALDGLPLRYVMPLCKVVLGAAQQRAPLDAQRSEQAVRALVLRLGPLVVGLLRPAASRKLDADELAWRQMLARNTHNCYLHLLESHDTKAAVQRALLQQPGMVAALLEAGLRAQVVSPQGLTGRFATHTLRTIHNVSLSLQLPGAEALEAASAAAADPATRGVLARVLATALKDAQAARGDESMRLTALGVAGMALCVVLCLAEPGFNERDWSPAGMRGPAWLADAASSTAGSSGGGGTSSSRGSNKSGKSSRGSKEPACSALELYVVLAARALHCWCSYMEQPLARGSGLAGESADTTLGGPAVFVCAVHWLGLALPALQLPGEPGAAAAALQRLREQQAQLAAGLEFSRAQRLARHAPADSSARGAQLQARLLEVVSVEAVQLGARLGAALCAELPLPLCCNNLACTNLGLLSEEALVRGRLCAGCRRAAYCCADCQRAHWKAGHKEACKRLQQQRGGGGGGAGVPAPA